MQLNKLEPRVNRKETPEEEEHIALARSMVNSEAEFFAVVLFTVMKLIADFRIPTAQTNGRLPRAGWAHPCPGTPEAARRPRHSSPGRRRAPQLAAEGSW